MSASARWVALLTVFCAFNYGWCLKCYECSSQNLELFKGNQCENATQLRRVTCQESDVCLKGAYNAYTTNNPSGVIRMTMLRCVPDLTSSDKECEIIFKSMEAAALQFGGNVKQIHCSTCKSDLCNRLSVSSGGVYLPSFVVVLLALYSLFCV